MSHEPFDDLDRALASGLSALAPEVVAGDEALAGLRPRFEQARNRRRAMRAGGVILAVVALGSAAALAAPSAARSHVRVAVPSSLPGTTEPHRPATTKAPATTLAPTTTSTATTVPPSSGPTHSRRGGSAGYPVTVPATTPVTAAGAGGPGAGGGSSPTTTVPGRPEVKTYTSPGGSIKVELVKSALHLIAAHPASDCGVEPHDRTPGYIEVRFGCGDVEWRIEVGISKGQIAGHVVRVSGEGRSFRIHAEGS